jgi:signal transduction histidine kinase
MTTDQVTVLTVAAGCVAVVGLVGHIGLRLMRGSSIAAQLMLISAVSLAAVATAVAVDAQVMFLSAHDSLVVGLALVAATPLAVICAAWLGRDVRQSAATLAATAREIAAPTGPPSASTTGRPVRSRELALAQQELLRAGTAVRAARDHEQAIESSRRELVAWISHDLRTPLAGIRAMAEALEDGVSEDPGQYHKQLRVEADRLATMVDTLFLLSRLHAGSLLLKREPVDLRDLISDAVASVRPIAAAQGIAVTGDCPAARTVISVDAGQLSRALTNLLVNGIRHTTPAGAVVVTTELFPDHVRLQVQDACGGIAAADLERVFELAWRGSTARSSGPDGGGGLGLSVTQAIVRAHGGTVSVLNSPPGCRFEIQLPLAID